MLDRNKINQPFMYWVEQYAQLYGEQSAIVYGSQRISYAYLNNKSKRLASGLESLGIGKGDVVAVQLPNVPEFIICYIALCRVGAIMQTLHMPYGDTELRQLLGSSKARAIVCLPTFKKFNTAHELLRFKESSVLEHVVVLGDAPEGALSFQQLMQSEPQGASYSPSLDDTFLLLYTSGTTSSPKGVPISYRNFMGNALLSAQELDINQQDRILSLSPMSHLYGIFSLHVALISGATTVLLPAFTPSDFVELMKTDKPTGVFAGPAHLHLSMNEKRVNPTIFDATRFICLSGSTVTPELAQSVDQLLKNGSVIQLWGMSELQAGSFGRIGDPLESRCKTAGRASPNTQLRIVDSEGQLLVTGEEGEIQIYGASVFSGYLNNDHENRKAFTEDGWFRSGDIGRLDEHGYLQLTGRLKEIINRGGIKYNPLDVEAIIDKMEGVQRSIIVPIIDKVLGEKACVFILPEVSVTVSLDEILAWLDKGCVAKFKWPEILEVVTEFPLTPTQKVIRGKLGLSFLEDDE